MCDQAVAITMNDDDHQRAPVAGAKPRLTPEDAFVLWAHGACLGGGTVLLAAFLHAVGTLELPAALALFVSGGSLLSACWRRLLNSHRDANS